MISKYNIIKWYKMITGKSILHVKQDVGKFYSSTCVRGYYNDLREKVIRDHQYESEYIPKINTEAGLTIEFPISIFQYGLGAYDLYLDTNDTIYLQKFRLMCEWALEHQLDNGAWDTFSYIYPENPYSAMAQGEGVSLLLRAYIEFKKEKYLTASQKAIDFMMLPIEKGGTSVYKKESLFLKEYTHRPVVLNGWIFAIFGLYDMFLLTKSEKVQELLDLTVRTLSEELGSFDNGYWSMYDNGKTIASYFYHNLHIAQLSVIGKLFENNEANRFYDKWSNYNKRIVNRQRAFWKKVIQKVME